MKKSRRHAATLLTVAGAAWAHAVHAGEGANIKFSGFGTAGVVSTSTNDAQFESSSRQASGAGESPDFGVDSRLGLQADARFSDNLSAVGQLLARKRDGSDRPQVEWLFAQASVMPWLDLRVGRLVLPVFLISDSLNVGYSSHWVRPPSEIYSLYPGNSYDGVQAQAQTSRQSTNLRVQASAGSTSVDAHAFGSLLHLDLRNLYSLNLVAENGSWTFRLGDTEARDKVTGLGAPLALADSFRGVGMAYDDAKLLVQAEYVQRRTGGHGAFDMNGFYLTGGYRFGNWMPYATFSRYQPKGSLLSGQPATGTQAAGLRWDAVANVAVKAQFEAAQNNGINFVKASPSFALGRKVDVYTLLVDFVF